MNRSGLQRLVPVVLVLIIVIVAITALVSLGRTLFSGGGESASPSPTTKVVSGEEALTSTLADRSVRMTVRGPIVGDDRFHSYRVTVSPDMRNMTTFVGYLKTEVANEQLDNNTRAYEEFVHALDIADLMGGTPLTGEANDTRGVCATGMVYEFEVRQGNNTIEKLWTSSCKAFPGSLKTRLSTVTRLFQLQIPDYSKLVSGIKLSS